MNLNPILEEYLSARKSNDFFDEKPFYDKLKSLEFSTFECNEILKELDSEWELVKSFNSNRKQLILFLVLTVSCGIITLILARFGFLVGRNMYYSVVTVGGFVVATWYYFQKQRSIRSEKERMTLRWENK